MSKRAADVSGELVESVRKSARVSRTGRMCPCGEEKAQIESKFGIDCYVDGYLDRAGELCAHCKAKSEQGWCNISTRRCEVCCLPVCDVECGRGLLTHWTCGTAGGLQCDAPVLCLGMLDALPDDVERCFKCKTLFCGLHVKGKSCDHCDKYCCEVCIVRLEKKECCNKLLSDDDSTECDEDEEGEEEEEGEEGEEEDGEVGEDA